MDTVVCVSCLLDNVIAKFASWIHTTCYHHLSHDDTRDMYLVQDTDSSFEDERIRRGLPTANT